MLGEKKCLLFCEPPHFFPLMLSILPNIPSTRRTPRSVFATKRAHSATNNILDKPAPSVWVFPEIHQIGRWKIKHPGTFLGHGPLSLEHWPLWLAGVRWPCPIPPSARHSSQCKQKRGALIRDARRWQFISWSSCLMKPLCHAHWVGAHAPGRRQYRWGKANKDVLCALLFLCDVFFNFLRGGRQLPYRRLFIPANRLVAFCLQVTQPEVTFNSWTKKCVVMLYGAASKPEQITNTTNLTRWHSWPIAKASRPTERQRQRERNPTRCIHQSLSVSRSPLMPHQEAEQN